MQMTTDEIDREMTGWIEPTVCPQCKGSGRVVTYANPPVATRASHVANFEREELSTYLVDCDACNGRGFNAPTIKPTKCLDDAVRCVEARFGPGGWIKQVVACYHQQMRVSSYEPYEYFDNNHALALCLAAMSAVKGERVEVTP